MKSLDMAIQLQQQHSEYLKQTIESECEMNMFETYQVCQSGVMMSDSNVDSTLMTKPIADIRLTQNVEKLTEVLEKWNLDEVGKLSPQIPTPFGCENWSPEMSTPFLFDKIHTKVWNDINSIPVDIYVLHLRGCISTVITDLRSESIKSFYKEDNRQRYSKLKLDGEPGGITQLKHKADTVAVTHSNQISFIKVTPDLKHESTLKTIKNYWGVAALNTSSLVAGSPDDSSVDIIDLTGKVLKSFSSKGQLSMLSSPGYITRTSSGNILVSDLSSKCIISMTPSGDVVFTYRGTGKRALAYPRGIAATSTGDILVADRDTNKVIQLTASGYFVRHVLTAEDGIDYPRGLFLDGNNKLHVCVAGAVQVYSFS